MIKTNDLEKLLELAAKSADQAEIFALGEDFTTLGMENSELKGASSSLLSGVSLRVVKNGRIGMSYSRSLSDPRTLLNMALGALGGGSEFPCRFPCALFRKSPKTHDSGISKLTAAKMAAEGVRVCKALKDAGGQVNVDGIEAGTSTIRVLNSSGADLAARSSAYWLSASVLMPGSYSSVGTLTLGRNFVKTPDASLKRIKWLYKAAQRIARPPSGRIKVLFLPETMYALMWRLSSALSAKNVFHKQSPLADRLGQKVFSQMLSIYDDPLDDSGPGARGFDDEGTVCKKLALVERGAVKNFFSDLYYAHKLEMKPTGHGYRTTMFEGDALALKPVPAARHLNMKPGSSSFDDMIAKMDRGVIVCGMLGAHSGNIVNGDFSVGLSPGIYVENGEPAGGIKDALITGNIYETLKNVVAVEDSACRVRGGVFPAVLVDGISLSARG